MPYLGDPALSIALDFPYRSRSVALDYEKQAAKFRIGGLVRLRQFVLAVACLRLDDGNTLLGAERMEAARKGPRIALNLRFGVIEKSVRSGGLNYPARPSYRPLNGRTSLGGY